MGRSHSHGGHEHGDFSHAFSIGVALNSAFILAEFVFGFAAHSLSLIADGGHNLSDVLGLLMAWAASKLVRSAPTPRRTYGFRRSSILAALGNAVILLAVTGALSWEAVRRLAHPESVEGNIMIWVAAFGVIINGVTASLFMAGRTHDLNLRGAFLHMAGDAAISLGVVVAGVLIHFTNWLWLDPAVSLAIGVLIAIGTWGLLRDSVNLSLDAVPEGINPASVEDYLAALPGVIQVHDLHIWAMSTTETALTVHIVKPDGRIEDSFLCRIKDELRDRFSIGHVTVQCERGEAEHPCEQEPAHTV